MVLWWINEIHPATPKGKSLLPICFFFCFKILTSIDAFKGFRSRIIKKELKVNNCLLIYFDKRQYYFYQ